MIYTVTFNPAIDYIMFTDELSFGKTNRSKSEQINFGGKGINVSFVLKELGAKSTALGFVAGFTGQALDEYVNSNGIDTDFVRLDKGNTRINVKLKGGCETEINAIGPEISDQAMQSFFEKLNKIQDGDTIVLSGSIPKSVSPDIYEMILKALMHKKIKTVVDAEGKLLLNTLKYRPFLIKPNLDELEMLAKRKLENDAEIIAFAKELQVAGAMNVLVTLGANGAILVDENGFEYRIPGKKITAVNTVGAGDSAVAGFIVGAEKSYKYALELAVACGTATASVLGLANEEIIRSFL